MFHTSIRRYVLQYLSEYFIYRLARRCHLTEQIGARRRDLYISDTWAPLDDAISWGYKSSPSRLQHSQAPRNTPAISQPPRDTVPMETSTSSTLQTSQHSRDRRLPADAKLSRDIVAFSLSIPKAVDLGEVSDLLLRARHICAAESSNAVTQLRHDSKLWVEEYFCLFHLLGMDSVTERLAHSSVPAGIRNMTKAVSAYASCVLVPTAEELDSLKSLVSAVQYDSHPAAIQLDLIRLHLFLHHPLITQFITTFRSAEKTGMSQAAPLLLTKSQISALRSQLPEGLSLLVSESLKAKTVSLPLLYRIGVASLHLRECDVKSKLQPMLEAGQDEFGTDLKRLTDIRLRFEQSLFPA